MGNVVANVYKGRIAYIATLPAANDALIVIPLEATGLVADATLIDYQDAGTMIAGATNEQTTLGRKTVTASVTSTVDYTNDWVDVDIPDQVWTAGTGNGVGKLCIAYDNDTTGGTDANLIPLTYHDFVVTPDGSDITAQIATAGFYRAA